MNVSNIELNFFRQFLVPFFGNKFKSDHFFFLRKVFFQFSTENLRRILETFLKSEDDFSKIINKMANSNTRIYTFDVKSFNNPNSHNHRNSHAYPNSHTFLASQKCDYYDLRQNYIFYFIFDPCCIFFEHQIIQVTIAVRIDDRSLLGTT